MPTSRKTPSPPVDTTFTWFEREIVAHTPQQSILDATSLGIWTICEQAGTLAGAWKQHRILRQELDTAQVAATLGELMGAIAQTANAIGMPLETVMLQHVAQVQTTAPKPSRQPKAAVPATTPATTASAAVVTAKSVPPPQQDDKPRQQVKRQRRSQPAAVPNTVVPPPPAPLPLPVNEGKRGRPRKAPIAAGGDQLPTPVLVAPTPKRGAKRPAPVQPTLLSDAVPAPTTPSQRTARAGGRAR